jgi:hypothetical protein
MVGWSQQTKKAHWPISDSAALRGIKSRRFVFALMEKSTGGRGIEDLGPVA